MQKFKNRWEITSNWQLIFPVLGIIGLLISSFLLAKKLVTAILKLTETDDTYIIALFLLTIFFFIPLLGLTLKIFNTLEKKWNVSYRWELIAIFIAFAITGSTSARISDPILTLIGFHRETTNDWIYWPLRI